MYDHIGLKTTNLDASVRFYSAALSALGHELCSSDATGASFGPAGQPSLYVAATNGGKRASPITAHIAFRAPSRAAVDRFFAAGIDAGGKDNGAPAVRVDYSPTYYAAFLIDPDGNNVEAVCQR